MECFKCHCYMVECKSKFGFTINVQNVEKFLKLKVKHFIIQIITKIEKIPKNKFKQIEKHTNFEVCFSIQIKF